MDSRSCQYGLGVYRDNAKIYLYFNSLSGSATLRVDISTDGYTFKPAATKAAFVTQAHESVNTRKTRDYRLSKVGNKYYLVYRKETETGLRTWGALSKNLCEWREFSDLTIRSGKGEPHPLTEPGMVVPGFTLNGQRVMFYGSQTIKVALTDDLADWVGDDVPVLSPRHGTFDDGPLTIADARLTKDGIAVLYFVESTCQGQVCFSVGSALFDRKNPRKLTFRSSEPLLEHVEGFQDKYVCPVGIVPGDNKLFSYWDVADEGVVVVSHPVRGKAGKSEGKKIQFVLEKLASNPILKPITSHFWESKAVFNPAAIYEQGKVHLVYRAVGENDVSVLGYAASQDGIHIDERSDEPIYKPRKGFELHDGDAGDAFSSPYFSGGAYGGVEDPRITRLGDRYYMLYVAYNGRNAPRVAMSSINVNDFMAHNWDQWADPVVISKPGVVDKNACILSEKINGKYVIFHRIYPNILVDYVDSLDFDGKTKWLQGQYRIGPRPRMWDSRKLGVGAPPIKTDDGWLLIYQGVDDRDASRYKIGAMLLDGDHPEKVLYRARKPIMEPDRAYENEGLKYGVVYPCGAVVKDGLLNVYYGGADTVVCLAQAPMDEFLGTLKRDEEATLYPVTVKPR